MKFTEDRRSLLKVVQLYYNQELTQAEIAKEMGMSRPVISKMLQSARAQGIVKIHINDPDADRVALGIKLQRKFQLNDVVIVPNENPSLEKTTDVQTRVARAGAAWLTEKIPRIQSIGLSWGTTLAALVEEMPYLEAKKLMVRPLVGGVASEHVSFDTNHLVFRLAEKLGGHCSYFYAPALGESIELVEVLERSQLVKKALSEAKAVDLAIIGVGNPQSVSTWQKLGYFTQTERIEGKIVGDGVASLFDKNGQTVDNTITKRMIGLKVEELSGIKEVLVLATGQAKVASLAGLLSGHRVTAMIIDQKLANELIKL